MPHKDGVGPAHKDEAENDRSRGYTYHMKAPPKRELGKKAVARKGDRRETVSPGDEKAEYDENENIEATRRPIGRPASASDATQNTASAAATRYAQNAARSILFWICSEVTIDRE